MANLVYGTNSSETINALDGVTNGYDIIYGYGGNDSIYGLGGDDYIVGGTGADALNGGTGSDTASYFTSAAGIVASLAAGEGAGGDAEGDTYASIENLVGSAYADALGGDDDSNSLSGLSGDDFLDGGDGDDALWGGSGNDTLKGGGGADALRAATGIDTASYYESPEGVIVLLGHRWGGRRRRRRHLRGHREPHRLDIRRHPVGRRRRQRAHGHGRQRHAQGLRGLRQHPWRKWQRRALRHGRRGLLRGDSGNDTLDGGAAGDTMIGGVGNDIYIVDAFDDVVAEVVGQGFDRVQTSVTYVLAPGSEVEVLETTDPTAVTAIDLVGNDHNNTITGNDGVNIIVGGLGIDTLRGNGGGDGFLWSSIAEVGSDDVVDYSSAQGDVLHFTNIDANETMADNQDFTFIGTAAFTAPGQINWSNNGTDTFIQLNTDADLAAEAIIQLHTAPSGDLVLMFL